MPLLTLARQLYCRPRETRRMRSHSSRRAGEGIFEVQVYRKDGSTAWVSNSVRAIRDSDGNITHFEGVVEDITERKRMEEDLRKSQGEIPLVRDYRRFHVSRGQRLQVSIHER